MGAIKTQKIRRQLLKKGFKEDSTHHQMYWFYHGERRTSIRTRLSHGYAEYGDKLLAQVARQMRLNKRQLLRFIDCAITYEVYLRMLLEAGEVDP